MDYRISNITVDLATSNNFGIVKAVQGDMRTRWVHITLLDNQIEYDVGKVYPVLRGTKPGGKTIFNKCTVSEDKKIIVELTEQILAEPGMSVYEIALYATPTDLLDDKEVITSFPFSVFVSNAAFNPSVVTSSDEFTAIADVMGDAAFLKECLDDIAISRDAAKDSELKAKDSENKSKVSEINAKESEDKAKTSEIHAKDSENKSKISETNAKESEINAATSAATATTKATESSNSALLSRSWAVGDTSIRPDEATNNSKFHAEQSKKYADSWKGSLLPKGTILFSQLPTSDNIAGHMYNISNAFITDERFKEGAGFSYPAGTNVYWSVDKKWDCLSGTLTMELTLAEYNALSEEQKMNGTIYYISDADNSILLVNETADGLMSHLDKIKLNGIANGATRVLIDSELSTSSQNAVQNKVVTNALTSTISTHNTSTTSHDDIRGLISTLATRLNALADSDDTTLDQLSEIVSYIKSNRSLIENITTNKINVSDIVNDLTSTATDKVLSANQGNVLKELVAALTNTVNDKVDKVSGKGLSTNDFTTEEKTKLSNLADNANNYSLPAASATTRGGVKTGYVQNGKKYPVQLDSEKMYVEVPWINDTYSAADTAPLGNGIASVGISTKYAREDHIHPLQTTVSGNAGSATKLQTAHTFKIGNTSKSFDGSEDVSWTLGEIGALTSVSPKIISGNLYFGDRVYITHANSNNNLRFTIYDGAVNCQLLFQAANSIRQFFPSENGTFNLGLSSYRWNTVYANNIISTNSVSAMNFTTTSRRKYKKNIKNMTEKEALKLLNLRPVTYDYKNGITDARGLIAEEVADAGMIYPVQFDENGAPDALDYSKFVPYIIKLIQFQQEQITQLTTRIEEFCNTCQ